MKPIWKIEFEGRDITARLAPHLISLSLTDARGMTSDDLSITLADIAGALDLPPTGSELSFWLGTEESGLTFKGVFVIDELESSGAPDKITIKSNSVDFTAALNVKRETFYENTTIGALCELIAGTHNLTPKIAPDMAGRAIEHISQTNESDINLLTRLAKDHGGYFGVKNQILIFGVEGSGQSASGQDLPVLNIDRGQTQSPHRFSERSRDNKYTGAKAAWNDLMLATKVWETAGDEGKVFALDGVYPSAQQASDAAKAALARLRRGELSMSITLAQGDASIIPDRPCSVSGFKAIINETNWIVKSVRHSLGQGFSTDFELETPPEL